MLGHFPPSSRPAKLRIRHSHAPRRTPLTHSFTSPFISRCASTTHSSLSIRQNNRDPSRYQLWRKSRAASDRRTLGTPLSPSHGAPTALSGVETDPTKLKADHRITPAQQPDLHVPRADPRCRGLRRVQVSFLVLNPVKSTG